ncbi:unnamed protein product [Urochloa humidicola]
MGAPGVADPDAGDADAAAAQRGGRAGSRTSGHHAAAEYDRPSDRGPVRVLLARRGQRGADMVRDALLLRPDHADEHAAVTARNGAPAWRPPRTCASTPALPFVEVAMYLCSYPPRHDGCFCTAESGSLWPCRAAAAIMAGSEGHLDGHRAARNFQPRRPWESVQAGASRP